MTCQRLVTRETVSVRNFTTIGTRSGASFLNSR